MSSVSAQETNRPVIVSALVTPIKVNVKPAAPSQTTLASPTEPLTVPEGEPLPTAPPPPRRPMVDPTFQGTPGTTKKSAGVGEAAENDAVSAPIVNFPGITSASNPPDTTGDVGPNHYIQMVNATRYQIFNKSGTPLTGALLFGDLWTPPKGNSGDPIVVYDHLADRWILSQFFSTGMYFAISQTSDPTAGTWFLYEFTTSVGLPDYPKIGVWPDAFYMSTFESPSLGIYAFDRVKMLAGLPASFVKTTLPIPIPQAGVRDTRILPVDLDGPAPALGTPGYFVRTVDDRQDVANPTDRIEIYEAIVNWAAPSLSFNVVNNLIPAAFDTLACNRNGAGIRDCIPQPNTTATVDALSNRPMMQLKYRNFGSYAAMVFNQAIDVSGSIPGLLGFTPSNDVSGLRWYQLIKSNANWEIGQQGTFSPQPPGATNEAQLLHRWMASAAMNGRGDIAIGYSIVNDDDANPVFPGIRYTGRLFGDPAGTMPQGEGIILTGVNSKGANGAFGGRWGDYSQMGVDPTDDCTFWFTTHDANGATRIASFTMGVSCAAPVIAGATSALIAESCTPGNGAVDPGETVTVSLALTNVGFVSATNIVATLLPTGGVTAPSGPQIYGAMPTNGPVVSNTFTFTADGPCGGTVTATLQLTESALNIGTVTFVFPLSVGPPVGTISTVSVTNSTLISIPQAGAATPYPSSNTVSGVSGAITKATVMLLDFTHPNPADLDVLLVSPTGQKVMLMSDAGGSLAPSTNLTITASDSGHYDSTGFHQSVTQNHIVGRNGTSANDLHRNFFTFNIPANVGNVVGAQLRLNTFMITTTDASENYQIHRVTNSVAALTAGGSGLTNIYDDLGDGSYANRVLTTNDANQFVTITLGPVAAADIAASAGAAFALGGSITTLSGDTNDVERVFASSSTASSVQLILQIAVPVTLTFDDAGATSLPTNNLASGTFKPTDYPPADAPVPPAPAGPYSTNLSALIGTEPNGEWQLFVFDDTGFGFASSAFSNGWVLSLMVMATNGCCLDPASADVGLTLTAAPEPVLLGSNLTYTIIVSNSGPATATGVTVTNNLPGTANFLSAFTTQGTVGTNASGQVVAALGSLASGATATITVNASPTVVGTLTATANVVASQFDYNSFNNSTSAASTVILPSLTISDVSVGEGNAGTVNAVFTVTLAPAFGQAVTVNFATANSTAVAGSDYVSTNGLLTFPPGSTNQTVTVLVNGDILSETNETYFLNLSSPSNAVLGDAQGLGTIVDNDPVPTFQYTTNFTVVEGNVGPTNVTIALNLSAVSGRNITVFFTTANSTASAGTDYVSRSATATFPPGTTTSNLVFTINGDITTEPNELFFVNFSSALNATLTNTQARINITNDDGLQGNLDHFSWSAIGSPQTVNESFLITLTALDNTNALATNFTGPAFLSGFVTSALPTGSILISELQANSPDFAEFVNVSNTAVNIGGWQITLYDFDSYPAPLTNFIVPAGTIVPPGGVFRLTELGTAPGTFPNFFTGANIDWGNSSTAPIAVLLRDSASSLVDFACVGPANPASISSPVVIPPSQWSGTTIPFTTVTTVDYQRVGNSDNHTAGDWVTAAPSGGTNNAGLNAPFVPSLAPVTISPFIAPVFTNGVWAGFLSVQQVAVNMFLSASDNNGHTNASGGFNVNASPYSLSINNVSQNENTGPMNFTVTLTPTNSQTVTVAYSTVDGTATAGSDYTTAAGVVTFLPGQTNQPVSVLVSGDATPELNETFYVVLGAATNAAVVAGSGRGTLLNDDAAPLVTNEPRNDFWMPNNTVNAVLETNGAIYLGGTFTEMGVTNLGRLAPFDPATGDVLLGFPIVNRTVNAVVPDGSGGWYIGGDFTSVGGLPRFRLARINADRTVDPNFTANCSSIVSALLLNDTNLLVGGLFTAITNGVTVYNRARFAALDPATGVPRSLASDPQFNSTVSALATNGTTLYLGGAFTTITNGVTVTSRSRLAAIDLLTGQPTAWVADADSTVNTLAVGPSAVYAGGAFTGITNGALQQRFRFAALDLTSGAPTTPVTDFSSTVQSLLVSGSRIYVGGFFSVVTNSATPVNRTNLVAIDATTGAVSAWQPTANGVVRAMALNGTNLFVGGDFAAIGGQSDRRRLASVSIVTALATAFDPDVGGSVNALAADATQVYAGGAFNFVKGTIRNRAAAVDAVTGALLPWNPNASSTVQTLAASGTNIYLGGFFTTVGGTLRNRLAAVNDTSGALVTAFSNNFPSTVRALALGGTNLYVGGEFTNVTSSSGTLLKQGLAAVNPSNGAVRTGFTANLTPLPSTTNGVFALAYGDGTLYAGGTFTNIGGQLRLRLAALDGATGTPTAWNPNMGGAVNALTADGNIVLAGGAFSSLTNNGTNFSRGRLAALDVNTGIPATWNPAPVSTVNALAVRGTNVITGGVFTTVGGQARNFLAGLDATLAVNTPEAWNPNMQTTVNAVAANESRIIAGGFFTAVGAQARPFFAVFQPDIAPVITTSGSALTYTENDPPTPVDAALTLTDSDSATMVSATVRVAANLLASEDVLEFTPANGIVGFFYPPSGTLNLSGQSAVSNYQAALRSVTYRNLSGTPSTLPRSIEFIANDAVLTSVPKFRTVNVVAVNDPPTISTIPAATTVENWSTAAIPFTVGDEESDATNLFLSALPSNPVLAPAVNITFGGSGSNRTVRVQPGTNQSGATTITIFLSDGTNVVSTPLLLTVLADTDHDGVPDVYEMANGMNKNDPTDAVKDFDGDGMSNLQEYLSGTDPNDSRNYLRIVSIIHNGADTEIAFTSIAGKFYRVERTDDLIAGVWSTIADNVAGTGASITINDAGAALLGQRSYRVRLLP